MSAWTFHRIRDVPTDDDWRKLNILRGDSPPAFTEVRIQSICVKRPPKAGEWFISGAIPEGYRAEADLETPHIIGRLVIVRKRCEWEEVNVV